MRKLDFDRLREAQRESAVSEVKGALVLDRIADVENIQVSDEEMERELSDDLVANARTGRDAARSFDP